MECVPDNLKFDFPREKESVNNSLIVMHPFLVFVHIDCAISIHTITMRQALIRNLMEFPWRGIQDATALMKLYQTYSRMTILILQVVGVKPKPGLFTDEELVEMKQILKEWAEVCENYICQVNECSYVFDEAAKNEVANGLEIYADMSRLCLYGRSDKFST